MRYPISIIPSMELIITLPALQKNFVNIFFVFAWEFRIEKWQGFLVIFFWSPSPTKRSAKSPRKIRGKFGAKFGAKFGTKFRKFGKLSFCNFSGLTNYHLCICVKTITNENRGVSLAFAFVMERQTDSPRFSFVCASVMNMLGTYKQQQQSTTMRTCKRQRKSFPEGLERHLDAARQKIAARQFLPLNCRAITLSAGAILKEEKNVLSCGGEAIWETF